MKRYGAGRILAALFLGAVLGAYVHFDEMRWAQRGRDAFLAYENHRFDQRMVSPHSGLGLMLVGMVFVGVGVGMYELIAAGIAHALPPSTAEEL
jgi:hypothetical protein